MFAVVALVLAGTAVQSVPAPSAVAAPVRRCTAVTLATCAGGSWTGTFTGAEWTFEFERENGAWTGRYRTTRGKRWQPLLDLAVANGKVSFGIVSTPKLTFRLVLDPDTDALGGQVQIEGLITLPFTAVRSA